MKDEHTYGKNMAKKVWTKVIYKGAFVSKQSLVDLVFSMAEILTMSGSYYGRHDDL